MTEKPSIYKQFEGETRRYYGADKDPLKFVPAVLDPEVAHGLALEVERSLSGIDEADVAKDALRIQRRNRIAGGDSDLQTIEAEVMQDRLRRVVVNTEMEHARKAPGDFNEDSERAGAFGMATGVNLSAEPPRQTPPPENNQ